MRNILGRHMREDGIREDKVECAVIEGKTIRRCCNASGGVCERTVNIRMMESEIGPAGCDVLLTPSNGFPVAIETLVATTLGKKCCKGNRNPSNATPYIERARLWPQIAERAKVMKSHIAHCWIATNSL